MEINSGIPFGMPNSRNVPATPPPEDLPVAPLPPIVGTPEPAPGPEDVPVIPLPPMDGTNPPVDTGPGADVPVIPLPPMGSTPPVAPGPVLPNPILPTPGYCTVRFLNAVMDGEPMRVTVGNRTVARSLDYGSFTGYYSVPDGFRTVTAYSVRMPWNILFQASVPMSAGEVITLAFVRSGGVLDLVRISDLPCSNRPRGRACIRAVNLVYNSPALDVVLADGRVVFTDVREREVTTWRQARPGSYDFYIAQTPFAAPFRDIQTVEDLPYVMSGYYLPGFGAVQPLTSFTVDAKAGAMESIYLLGNWNIDRAIRAKVVESY